MPIFELGDETILPIEKTTFASSGHKERDDLQRLLRDQIEVVTDDVLIIAEEFGDWDDSRRRIDLLGIDKNANLVVIELKRTKDGGHMELQALRYSAMISTVTARQGIAAYGAYLKKRNRTDDPEQLILEFLEWSEMDEDNFGQDVRIVLVSADFSRELTTSVIWLNEKDLDIRCVRIRPYDYEGRTLIDVQQVIPLPEATDFQVQVREKKRQERAARQSNMDFTRYDISVNGNTYENQWKRNAILIVVKALIEKDISIAEIKDYFKVSQGRTVFLEVKGEINDLTEFTEAAENQTGKPFRAGRWHTSKDNLFVSEGCTYVFTNQWGKRVPKRMQELKELYPQIELEFSPSGS